MKPPSHSKMTAIRYLEPSAKYTICIALRDIYSMTDDQKIKDICRYASMLAGEIVEKVRQTDPQWLRNLYPRRSDFERIMGL